MSMEEAKKSAVSVALVSDFFYPSLGGVQMQIKQLSGFLLGRVKRVIVVTHCYPGHVGVKQVGGVRVYYLAFPVVATNIVFPNFVTDYPQAKQILLEEGIDVVHTHQSTSPLGIAFGMQAYHLGLRVVHTEHSLFEFKKIDGIIFPWCLAPVHQLYDRFICVSRATRNNLIIRNRQPSHKTIVIPNSVETAFVSRTRINQLNDGKIRLVLVSRMVFRRGIDILIQLLPALFERNSDIIIELVGDGAKIKPLKEMVRIRGLQDRTVVHGGLPNKQALQIVKKCDIFLNTALTQSFGIALVEAASLGLHVISGDVGGVVEVLPPEHLHIVELTVAGFMEKIEQIAVQIRKDRQEFEQGGPQAMVERANLNFYPKDRIFERVVEVYQQVMQEPRQAKVWTLLGQILRKGNLISILVLFFLLFYTIVDIAQAATGMIAKLFKNKNKID